MRFDRRFLVVVGVSLTWALLVSLLFYRLAVKGKTQAAAPALQPLVIATQPLEIGTTIKPELVKLSRVPQDMVPKGGFQRIEDVLGRPVISPIQPQEPVVEARLAGRGSGGGVAPLIPAGMRAVAVRVNDVASVAGFVLPGMRVDVLVTGSLPGREDKMTATVLQNIAVLSVGQIIQLEAKSQAINAPVVTLLVTPAEAEALALANTEGHIQLVLRNSNDQQVTQTAGRQWRELYGENRKPAPAPPAVPRPPAASRAPAPLAAAPAPGPPPDDVLIIRGSQKSIEAVPAPRGGLP